jgi:hypothetical protein
MRPINLFFISFFLSATCYSQTAFKMVWENDGLPFEIKIARASSALKKRVGETGTFSEKLDLPVEKQLPNGIVELPRSETAYVYLLIKNTSKRKIKFSVAPHSTHPGVSAIGFSFNCLCNGHIYTAEPNSIWYRVMELRNNTNNGEKNVELVHHIFEVKK